MADVTMTEDSCLRTAPEAPRGICALEYGPEWTVTCTRNTWAIGPEEEIERDESEGRKVFEKRGQGPGNGGIMKETAKNGSPKSEEVLARLGEVVTGIRRLERERNELIRRLTRLDYARLVNYYLRGMVDILGDREEMNYECLAAAYGFSQAFLRFLEAMKGHLVAAGHWPEDVSACGAGAELTAANLAEIRQQQEEFQQDWPKNTLKAARLFVADLLRLVAGKEEFEDKDLPALYESLTVFVYVFGETKTYVGAQSGEKGRAE